MAAMMLGYLIAFAIAPLLIIYMPDTQSALLTCAFVVAFFPILSNMVAGLKSVDHNLLNLFELYGANRWQTFTKVILPALWPALLTGFALAFARAVGEYGSVIFIAGNMPMKTEILPLLIMVKLDQYDYTGATAIGVLMLVVSFILLLLINLLQRQIAKS